MKLLDSPFGPVALTKERWQHIITFHPEVRSARKYLSQAVKDPKITRRSKTDSQILICYRKITTGKYLAVVIKTNARNFILTAYITNKPYST